jgi:TatD DNase family protein
MNFIDTHAHIYSAKFDDDRDQVIQDILESGVSRVYMPNVDVESIDAMFAAVSRVCIR